MLLTFLDVDGVLNPGQNIIDEYMKGNKTTSEYIVLDQECLANLKYIVEQTGTEIVLSSSWRKSGINSLTIKNLSYQLNEIGVHIYDYTPIMGTTRGIEIKDWLYNKGKIISIDEFIIIDDDSDMEDLTADHLIKCKNEIGLTRELAEEACKKLLHK